MSKIAIFGGTFDPIHLGHIAVAVALVEQMALDQLFFIPAGRNPFKQESITPAKHRYAMVEHALQGVPHCSALPLDLERPGPSFMIDTIEELLRSQKVRKEDTLFLVLGEDQLAHFHEWKSVEALVALAQPLVVRRTGVPPAGEWQKRPLLRAAVERGLCTTPLFDVSATQIRERLKKNLFCGHLLSPAVLHYITQHHLYE